MTTWRSIAFCTSLLFLVGSASAQLTVDATRPSGPRDREPAGGGGGSFARKLPLQVLLALNGSPPDENGKTLVTFILTNSGQDELGLPVLTDRSELGPPKPSYAIKMLSLYVTLDHGEGVDRHRMVLPGDAHTYGSLSAPGTIVLLRPGESIHVLTRVRLPTDEEMKGGRVIVGRVSLNNEVVRTTNRQISSDTQEIGSTSSRDYTLQSLTGN